MPSQFFGLNIGASALSAFQTSVNTAANNVANVQTKGYTRQTANLSATDPIRVYTRYGSVGTGVEVTSVTQERNLYYDEKYWQSNSSRGFFEQKLYYVDQVQTIFRDDEQSQWEPMCGRHKRQAVIRRRLQYLNSLRKSVHRRNRLPV